jgi:hypothetical protein
MLEKITYRTALAINGGLIMRTEKVLDVLLKREGDSIKDVEGWVKNQYHETDYPPTLMGIIEKLKKRHEQLCDGITNVLAAAPEIAREDMGQPPKEE